MLLFLNKRCLSCGCTVHDRESTGGSKLRRGCCVCRSVAGRAAGFRVLRAVSMCSARRASYEPTDARSQPTASTAGGSPVCRWLGLRSRVLRVRLRCAVAPRRLCLSCQRPLAARSLHSSLEDVHPARRRALDQCGRRALRRSAAFVKYRGRDRLPFDGEDALRRAHRKGEDVSLTERVPGLPECLQVRARRTSDTGRPGV